MTSVSPIGRPQARPDLLLRRVGSEWVLYDAARERAHVLNLTAAVIWTYCDGQHERASIADAIARETPGIDAATIRSDVDDTLRRFADEGLLR
jgi:broad specificity phosphatase PhoE